MTYFLVVYMLLAVAETVSALLWKTNNFLLQFLGVAIGVAAFLLAMFVLLIKSNMPKEPNKPLWPFVWPFGGFTIIPPELNIIESRRDTLKHAWFGHDIRFTDEVEAWCKENGVKHWSINPSVIWPGIGPRGPFSVAFPSKKKAMFFKLRWF